MGVVGRRGQQCWWRRAQPSALLHAAGHSPNRPSAPLPTVALVLLPGPSALRVGGTHEEPGAGWQLGVAVPAAEGCRRRRRVHRRRAGAHTPPSAGPAPVHPTPRSNQHCPTPQFGGDRDVVFLNGKTILSYYSLAGINPWGWMGIEAGFVAGALGAGRAERAHGGPTRAGCRRCRLKVPAVSVYPSPSLLLLCLLGAGLRAPRAALSNQWWQPVCCVRPTLPARQCAVPFL